MSPACVRALDNCACSDRRESLEDLMPPVNAPADFTPLRSGAEVDAAIKIRVDASGVHELSYEALVAAGVDAADLVGRRLRLYHGPDEVALEVSTEGLMRAGDWIRFYGLAFEDVHEANNCYWLGVVEPGAAVRLRWGAATPRRWGRIRW